MIKYGSLEDTLAAIDDRALMIDATFAAVLAGINAVCRIICIIHTFFINLPLSVCLVMNVGGDRRIWVFALTASFALAVINGIIENVVRKHFNEDWQRSKIVMAEDEFAKNVNFASYTDMQKQHIFTAQVLPVIGVTSYNKK